MIKRLMYVLFVALLGAAALAPGQAARAMPAVVRIGSPDFPAPVEVYYDPNAAPLVVDRRTPAAPLRPQAVATTITIDYVANGVKNSLLDNCLTFPDQAKAAFNDVATILKNLISSPVEIRIEACWGTFSNPGILGHSSAVTYSYDFLNAPQAGVLYPAALANALSGSDQDPASGCALASNCDDISITLASTFPTFYFGTNGHPGGLTDFESVVLHEIVHGLGFAGNMLAAKSGGVWLGGLRTVYPASYDTYAANSAGASLLNTTLYPRPGTALFNVLVGANGGVYFNGPNTRIGNGGVQARLYTPNPWIDGSSYSHLDTSFDGTPNALMTWSIGPGEALHDPGPVGYGVLKDVGWAPWPASALTVTQTNLSWADNSNNETGFRLERSSNGATGWTSAGTVGAGVTTMSDTIVTVTADYYYRVVAYHALGDAHPSNVVFSYGVPTTLTLAAPLPNRVTLSWANGSLGATAFTVQRSPTGAAGNWASLPAGGTLGGYTDNGVAEGTRYYYRIFATGPLGISPFSPVFNITTPLAKATGLIASTASSSQINVAWVNNSLAATSATVQRSANGTTGWADLVPTVAPGSTIGSFSDTSVSDGAKYYYRVIVTNAIPAQSAPSDAVSAITPLIKATGLIATPASSSQINVAWVNNSLAATSATVQRSANGTTGWADLVPTVAPGSTIGSFPNTGLAEGTKYYYRVIVTNAVPAASVPSDPISATTFLGTPTAVGNHTLPTPTQVDLGWTNNSTHQTGFDIYRADGTPVTFVFKGHSATTNYVDTSVADGVQYYYQVRATNATNSSADSAPFAVATPLAAPTLFAGVLSNTTVNLSWTDNSANETGFTIQRSPNGTTGWVTLGTAPALPGTGLSGAFTDPRPLEISGQYYQICATNAFTCSAYVKSAVVTTPTLNLPAPVSAFPLLDKLKIKILWTDNSLLETGYQVQWSATAAGPWVDVTAATAANVTSFQWTVADGIYFIQVRALHSTAANDSPFTVPVKVVKGPNWTFIPQVTK